MVISRRQDVLAATQHVCIYGIKM